MVAKDLDTILEEKYPSKLHSGKVVELIRQNEPEAYGILYVEGRETKCLEDSDLTEPFRQRRNFYYLTGCNLGDSVFIYDLQASEIILFIPPINPDEVLWSGPPLDTTDAARLYDVDHVWLTSKIQTVFLDLERRYPNSKVYTIPGQVSEGVNFGNIRRDTSTILKEAIETSRIIKDDYEIALIRKANQISGNAHHKVMRNVGKASNEMELEATFVQHCISHGSKVLAYPPIAASGRVAATLHYEANNASLSGKLNILLDAGTEWNCYASDITRSFPVSGHFTQESKHIYDIVLQMQQSSMNMIKGGADWDQIHLNAHQTAIDGLLRIGLLEGKSDDLFKAQISLAFFPHGLGHYLGLDVHDVGGKADSWDENKMLRLLRKRGPLPTGSVITVEPGIYFCKDIIMPYLDDTKYQQFINVEVLVRYWDVGGIRIEDNVLVTEDGYENLTTVIKDLKQIEEHIIDSRSR